MAMGKVIKIMKKLDSKFQRNFKNTENLKRLYILCKKFELNIFNTFKKTYEDRLSLVA